MKYYLIAGEASGDLHASRLMAALSKVDDDAEFRFFGGDLMAAVGGTCVKHYRDLAFMGIIPVLLHLPTILRNMALCKRDIVEWQPDVVVLVDYPGFNLDIAKYIHSHTRIPVYYYISPKIWAWKEWRINASSATWTRCSPSCPSRCPSSSRNTTTPSITWAILRRKRWKNFVRDIRSRSMIRQATRPQQQACHCLVSR